jgi:hypothetical protein
MCSGKRWSGSNDADTALLATTLYRGTVSMSVLVVLCALLIVAGGLTILAAVMGNPVRIGPLSVPGPEGATERAVIGVVGAVCVAAVLPVVLMNHGTVSRPFTVANSTTTPEPTATATATPTPFSTPPAGPSVVAASPGVPSVTSIAVGQDSATGCVRTFTATVRISDSPVTVHYRGYVNGGETFDRSKSVSGTGARPLDSIQVTATHSGVWTVRFDVLGPNPSVLTGTATWSAPAACDPSPSTTTTSPPSQPMLTITNLTVAQPNKNDSCGAVTVNVSATLTAVSAPAGLEVTYVVAIAGQQGTPVLTHVGPSAPATGSATVPSINGGSVGATITANADGVPLASATNSVTITCT